MINELPHAAFPVVYMYEVPVAVYSIEQQVQQVDIVSTCRGGHHIEADRCDRPHVERPAGSQRVSVAEPPWHPQLHLRPQAHRMGQAHLLQNMRRSSATGLAQVACRRTLRLVGVRCNLQAGSLQGCACCVLAHAARGASTEAHPIRPGRMLVVERWRRRREDGVRVLWTTSSISVRSVGATPTRGYT